MLQKIFLSFQVCISYKLFEFAKRTHLLTTDANMRIRLSVQSRKLTKELHDSFHFVGATMKIMLDCSKYNGYLFITLKIYQTPSNLFMYMKMCGIAVFVGG